MTTASPTQILSMHAHRLMIAAPREWETFVEVFDAYTTEVTVAVTAAEQNEILVAQGRAKAFLHLLKTFRECHVQSQQTKPPSP